MFSLWQWLIFIHAWFAQTEHFFDLTGSLTYIVLVLAACYLSEAFDIRSLVIVGLVLIWALRLGPFLFFRIQKAGEDRRFRSIKVSFPTFFMTWTLQGAWVFVTVSAGLGAITSGSTVAPELAFYIGLAMWIVGFAIEVIAGQQKPRFVRIRQTPMPLSRRDCGRGHVTPTISVKFCCGRASLLLLSPFCRATKSICCFRLSGWWFC